MTVRKLVSGAVLTALLGVSLSAGLQAEAATPGWNATGDYVIAFNYLGSDYNHDLHLTQDSSGNLTGSGGSPAGANTYLWTITSGTVSGDAVDFYANYTATADAVTPQTTMHVTGTIASDGTLSGTWSDNYQGGERSGTFSTVSGAAAELATTLAAEDFGVVSYDTGLGTLSGYTAGFGLANGTFSDVQSVVVKLYAGDQLLQTDTATSKINTITGSQISSPFDVSGTFDYAADGYWTNTRATEYGQTLAATRVVAAVTLADGTVLTAENTTLAGDPTTIMPTTPPPPPVTGKDECKNGGWKTFTNPSYKNQGQCVSAMAKASHSK